MIYQHERISLNFHPFKYGGDEYMGWIMATLLPVMTISFLAVHSTHRTVANGTLPKNMSGGFMAANFQTRLAQSGQFAPILKRKYPACKRLLLLFELPLKVASSFKYSDQATTKKNLDVLTK
ncbi:MAG: hypothetical protein FD121_438 [Gallionellaceae bacterium]|nr:MAG: hypothetical protein FD121_438 [Gallionellaceae bacterium]